MSSRPGPRPAPTTYDPATLDILPTAAEKYLPAYPYRVVHWFRTRPGWWTPLDGCQTLGHYRTRDEAVRALERLTRRA